jgi:hypothetical protein
VVSGTAWLGTASGLTVFVGGRSGTWLADCDVYFEDGTDPFNVTIINPDMTTQQSLPLLPINVVARPPGFVVSGGHVAFAISLVGRVTQFQIYRAQSDWGWTKCQFEPF